MTQERRPLRSRLVQGLGSQGLSSVSNFALVVMVARSSTPEQFGAFAIAYSVALMAVGAMRGAVGEVLAITHAARTDSRSAGPAALGAATACGLLIGLSIAIAGALWPHDLLGRWLLLFSPAIPLLVTQDAARFVGFSTHQPNVAVVTDGAWLAIQVLAWTALGQGGWLSAETLVVGWWLAAGLGTLAVVPITGPPSIAEGVAWLRRHHRLGLSFAAEFVVHSGAGQATVYAVGIAAGLPAAGALRAAQSMFGPVRAAVSGVGSIALPEAAHRRSRSGPSSMLQYAVRVTVVLSALAAVAGAALWLLPDQLGRSLLGSTWENASLVLVPVGLSIVGATATIGARFGLRAIRAASASLRLRAITGTLGFILGVGGAVLGGLVPAAWGLAIAHLAGAGLGWVALLKALRPPAR